jgi:hypothetical protein
VPTQITASAVELSTLILLRVKVFYVLRCFYGESLGSGEDLQVELRRLRRTPVVVGIIALTIILFPGSVRAAPPQHTQPRVIQAEELDRSIEDTMNEPQFRWRMPRDETAVSATAGNPALERWLHRVFHTIRNWWRSFTDWLDRLGRNRRMPESAQVSTGPASRTALEVCLIVFIIALVAMLGWKIRQYFADAPSPGSTSPKSPSVDLTDENVRAEELPEDEWLHLARELVAQGELNLALRALFFAGMSHLAHRQVIVLARHKSNRDYQIELRRRAPGNRELQNAFAENRVAVERAWYGQHSVDAGMLERFQSNLARIQAT